MNEFLEPFVTLGGSLIAGALVCALVGAVSEWIFGGIGKIVNRFRSK